jgi:hypothetical protein
MAISRKGVSLKITEEGDLWMNSLIFSLSLFVQSRKTARNTYDSFLERGFKFDTVRSDEINNTRRPYYREETP